MLHKSLSSLRRITLNYRGTQPSLRLQPAVLQRQSIAGPINFRVVSLFYLSDSAGGGLGVCRRRLRLAAAS